MVNKYACRVCGSLQLDPPWGEGGLCPTYEICDCCGVEFGYGDCILEAIDASRKKWLESGAEWKFLSNKPLNWSVEEQMKNIPDTYE